MRPTCLLGRHAAFPSDVRNLGLCVSQCRRCGRDLIRKRGRWTNVPRGFRIVWRRLDEVVAEAVPLKLIRNLPVPGRARPSVLPELARRAAGMIELCATACRAAGWALAERCRALRDSLLAPVGPRQLALPLPMP